jgi:hypothetical protein
MCTQAFERRNDIFLVHIHRVGDHARGLFEAEASPIVSATHTLQDVQVFFFVCHRDVSQLDTNFKMARRKNQPSVW